MFSPSVDAFEQFVFGVVLIAQELVVPFFGQLHEATFDLLECGVSIEFRFPLTKQTQIRAVDE